MGLVDAFARQQLEGMEQLRRDFAHRPRRAADDSADNPVDNAADHAVRRSRRRSRARR